MSAESPIDAIQFELQSGLSQAKCRKCGCMGDALQELRSSLLLIVDQTTRQDTTSLLAQIDHGQQMMEPTRYT